MKIIVLSLAFVLSMNAYMSDKSSLSNQEKPNVGDSLVVLENKGDHYRFVDFPRLNFLVKRGGLATYKNVYHKEVVVKEVIERVPGVTEVVLERADGKKFFNHKKSVTANYFKALSHQELKIKN